MTKGQEIVERFRAAIEGNPAGLIHAIDFALAALDHAREENLVRAQAAEREVDALREALRKQEYDVARLTLKAQYEGEARDRWRDGCEKAEAALATARAEEREACAKEADDRAARHLGFAQSLDRSDATRTHGAIARTCADLASAIRARRSP